MKKNLIFAMGLISITAFAQVGRVGINTDQPRATLDIVGKPFTGEATDKAIPRGVILPHISDAQKAEFTDKTEGLMIWNTTKKCIDYWDGTKWQCYNTSKSSSNPTIFTSTKSSSKTQIFTKNNCAYTSGGQQVSYTTPTYTETKTSNVSQEEADRLAQAAADAKALEDINTNGQNYANNNGKCTIEGDCTAWDVSPGRMTGFCTPGYDMSNSNSVAYMRFYAIYGGVKRCIELDEAYDNLHYRLEQRKLITQQEYNSFSDHTRRYLPLDTLNFLIQASIELEGKSKCDVGLRPF